MRLVFPRLARGSPTFITAFVQMDVPFLSRVEGMEGGKARRQLLEQYMVSLAKVGTAAL